VIALLAAQTVAPIVRVDLDGQVNMQTVLDREPGQYLGHPTTVLLRDGRTILAVYPKGHGKGAILLKRSTDGGKTWSDRLPTPKNWETSLETPTIHRLIDPKTKKDRLVLWSGLHPARYATSEDEGKTWTELKPAGTWGGIVVMSALERLKHGRYMALFHDDGRFFYSTPQTAGNFTLYKTFSADGGLTWSFPEAFLSRSDMHLCEPGLIRSPDGKTLAMLLRENSRKFNSQVIFSQDEGRTWTAPRALPLALTGDRHVAKYPPMADCLSRSETCRPPETGREIGWPGSAPGTTWSTAAMGNTRSDSKTTKTPGTPATPASNCFQMEPSS
jgi:hypothetical protein